MAHENEPNQPAPDAVDALADDQAIQKLEADLHEAGERLLRSQAELENYRKRARRELEEERRYALMPLVRDLLPIVDNLERAIAAAQQTNDAAGLLEGVKMVDSQFTATLAQHHCVKIETVGTTFDPHLHQAIAQEPSAEHAAGTITRSAQVGYTLHDRVARPAQVFVSTGAE
jgi:molecular chaperone GrpE